MTVIFIFSAQPGEESGNLSGVFADLVIGIFYPDYAQLDAAAQLQINETLSLLVRKLAHFSEFGLLAVFMLAHLSAIAETVGRPRRCASISWLLTSLYAGSDEFHQMFVDGRGPSLLDVGIDSCGALFGISLTILLCSAIKRSGTAARKIRSRAVLSGVFACLALLGAAVLYLCEKS